MTGKKLEQGGKEVERAERRKDWQGASERGPWLGPSKLGPHLRPHNRVSCFRFLLMDCWNCIVGQLVSIQEICASAKQFRFITNGAEWSQTLDMLPAAIILKLAFVGGLVIQYLATWPKARALMETQV